MMKSKDGNLLFLFACGLDCLRLNSVYCNNTLITSESTVVMFSHPLWCWQGLEIQQIWVKGEEERRYFQVISLLLGRLRCHY